MIAYCYASGLIEFGKRCPSGAIEIARGPKKSLIDFINVTARHGYSTHKVNGRTEKVPGTDCLLVPGVPEAALFVPKAAVPLQKEKALDAWLLWIGKNAPTDVTVYVPTAEAA